MRYAEVIVDIKSSNVDKVFDYIIPEEMNIIQGERVIVNFNRRKVEGIVIKIKDDTSYDKGKLKEIVEVKDRRPLLTGAQIELAYWMKERYLCYLVEALRCIMPISFGKTMELLQRVAVLKMPRDEVMKYITAHRRNRRQIAVLEELIRCNGLMKTSELIKLTQSDYSVLNRLKEIGIVDITYSDDDKDPYKKYNYLQSEKLTLTQEQQRVFDSIIKGIDRSEGKFLLHGVTGSGKTEIYLQAIEYNIKKGKEAIMLVPEISLTPQMIERFKSRFKDNVAVLHSRLSDGEKLDQWEKIRDGKVKVAVGVRSAVFAPFKHLGLIIIDEEHENTYKQSDMRPKYDAKEVAKKRCELEHAVFVMASATPSIQDYFMAMKGDIRLLQLKNRINNKKLPEIHLIDMRKELKNGNRSIFSKVLYTEIKSCIDGNRQIILFLNRRGFFTFVSCRMCGHVIKCPHCNISLTYHSSEQNLQCHYCGYQIKLPKICPKCGQKSIRYFGIGTERVEAEIKALFPKARILRMDVDTTRKKGSFEKIYSQFKNHEADILIGTQMISKGLDFPGVALVGIISADTTLNFPEYNASERTFQLITQVSGRAGRGDFEGKVIVQTYYPNHYSLLCVKNHDYDTFYKNEILIRKNLGYPPFSNLAYFTISGGNDITVRKYSYKLYDIINDIAQDLVVYKPVPALLHKLRDKYRWNIVLKSGDSEKLRYVIKESYDKIKGELNGLVYVSYDINYFHL